MLYSKIEEKINIINQISLTENDGIYRSPYTQVEKKAMDKIKIWMEDIGLVHYQDAIGNLWGQLEGSLKKETNIVTGSHIDTVRNAGKYDGIYGVIAGLLAVQELIENYGQPRRTIELAVFTGEEASRFPVSLLGSKGVVGDLGHDELNEATDDNGISVACAMAESGLNPSYVADAQKKDIGAFIEAHIDQGLTLEKCGVSIGIVHAIVSIQVINVIVRGYAAHAGTTSMDNRRDALLGVARIINSINEIACDCIEGVMTVGNIVAYPNCSNVVPGMVKFSIDIRHKKESVRNQLALEAKKVCENISSMLNLEVSWSPCEPVKPVVMSEQIVETLEQSCEDENLSYTFTTSGAGHDAMNFARKEIPTGMIFIPNKAGVSHNPDESTTVEDMENGIRVLVRALYKLAY